MFSVNLEIGPAFLVVSLVVFVAFISLVTLMHSTKEVTKGFQVTSLEEQRETLLREYEVKTMRLAEASSLDSLQNSAKFKSMVKPTTVVYVRSDVGIASR